ncbi:MAG TPA: hypothetical protein VH851_16665, partial [Candidatus Binatia bacterium]
PMWGCLGGMLITVDYFLTTAISAVSGFHSIGSAFAALDSHVVLLSCTGVAVLAALNIIGIRESAAGRSRNGLRFISRKPARDRHRDAQHEFIRVAYGS